MPEVYHAFLNEEVSVQMGETNPFGRSEALSKTPLTETVRQEMATRLQCQFCSNTAFGVKCMSQRNIQEIT